MEPARELDDSQIFHGSALLEIGLAILSARDEERDGEAPSPEYHSEDRVRIVGLRNQVSLNGSLARVRNRNRQHPSRWDVVPESSRAPGNSISVHWKNLVPMKESPHGGSSVLLHSLQDRADLNGKSARVRGPDPEDSSRVAITTAGNEQMSVPLSCTLLLAQAREDLGESRRAGQCIVCLSADQALRVSDPCGHRVVCQQCSEKFAADEPCPVCRRPVRKYIRVYD